MIQTTPNPVQQIYRYAGAANLDKISIVTLLAIANCESQLQSGVISPTKDVGIFQINIKAHLEESKQMGLDILADAGNIQYALYLYKKNGTADWLMSRDCWSSVTNDSLSMLIQGG